MNFQSLLPAIVIQIGFGFISGIIVGYTFKKLTRLLAIVLGLLFITIQILAYYKFIMVNWDAIEKAAYKAIAVTTASSPLWWKILITNFPYIGTFTLGFIIGFRKG
ncbi:MAG: FUN14 family protein [bacterium ADurb.Bin363]|nr:MAG: FUN14 family protein [bacterium ADurb.Bin363]